MNLSADPQSGADLKGGVPPSPSPATASTVSQRVLCVDLDGTLVATDLLWEGLLCVAREQPTALLRLPFWLRRGKAAFKREIVQRSHLDPASLPYREDVLAYIRGEHAAGRTIVLATAADESIAAAIAGHLGMFSGVVSSDGVTNLSGVRKCRALEEQFGAGGFDYIGDAAVDIPIWQAAQRAMLAAPPTRLLQKVRTMVPVDAVFSPRTSRSSAFLAALRPHQWVKNVLIFVPLLLDHQFFNPALVAKAFAAFVAFSLAASAGYVWNDILDIEADRKHPTKRNRPFASGALSPATGVALLPVLLVCAVAIAAFALPLTFLLLLITYLVITAVYSLYLKRIPVLDVIVLAGLYTLRVLAGIAATNVRFSTWLLAFSMFLFLSLAFMKRYAELQKSQKGAQERVARRGYMGADMEWLSSMGGSSGYMSVLVLALYISSDEVIALYHVPEVLWLICPLLLYWISRMWFRTHRGKLNEDPIVATARDPLSYAIGALVVVILVAAL